MTPLLLILTLINAAHGMAKGIKHEVASTHAQDQLSDPKARSTTVYENTDSTIQRTLLSTRRIPSTRRLQAKTFIHVLTSGKCAEKLYTDNPSTWNVDPGVIYRSHQAGYCNRLSIALRGSQGDNTWKKVNHHSYPGRNCFWKGGNTGELMFNSKGDEKNNKHCSTDRQCICIQPCEAGFFGSYDSVDCVACHPGRFSRQLYVLHKDDPSLACEACGVGQYQFDTPAACVNCPAGWYNDQKSQVECKSCNAGFYNNQNTGPTSVADCLACATGTFQSTTASTSCTNCAIGRFTDTTGQIQCKTCSAGKYQDQPGNTECKKCPAGRFNTDGTGTVNLHDELSDCTECVKGQYQTAIGSTGCTQCDPGTYTDQLAQIICKKCGTGTQNANSNSNDISACKECVAGKYGDLEGQAHCKDCGAGLYGTAVKATVEDPTCMSCAAGQHTKISGQASCQNCEDDSYISASLISRISPRVSCLPCPGAVSPHTTCAGCSAGQYGEKTGTGCKNCAIGFYAPGGDADSCKACPKGYHGDGATAASACEACVSGKYSSSQGTVHADGVTCTGACDEATSCISCVAGKYSGTNAGTSIAVCLACVKGRYNVNSAAGHISLCKECEPGRFSLSEARSTTCTDCDPGKFKREAAAISACSDCPAGWTQPLGVQSVCDMCLPGTAQISIGSTSCPECSVGKFAPVPEEQICTDCPQGAYQDEPGRASCLPCIPGKSAVSEASTFCTECTKGTYMNDLASTAACKVCPIGYAQIAASQSSCQECSPGYYAKSEEQESCKSCDSSQYAPETVWNASCLFCPVGYDSPSSSSTCSICPAGRAQTPCLECNPGQYRGSIDTPDVCLACPSGFYQPNLDSASCLATTPGTYQDESGQETFKLCDVGFFSNVSSLTQCYSCPPGTHQDVVGQASCLPCIPGTVNDQENQTTCSDCPVNTFTDTVKSVACKNCPLGRSTANEIGVTACSVCPAGTFGSSFGVCDNCPLGQFRTGGDNIGTNDPTTCVNCPAGYHQDIVGQASCLPCSPGFSENREGQSLCTQCAENTFASTVKLSTCANCEVGQVTFGKIGQASCQNCRAGQYGASCSKCVKGQFRAADDPDSTTCDLCPAGQYTGKVGMANCLPCSPGKFGASEGQKGCVNCVLGQYSLVPNQIQCKFCLDGTGTQRDGSSFCTECAKGKFSNAETAFNCDVCPIGYYGPKEGQARCVLCAPGLFATAEEQTVCVEAVKDNTRVIAPENIVQIKVLGDPFALRLNWTHDHTKGRLEEVPDQFLFTWSKTRAFDAADIVGRLDVIGGDLRTVVATIDPEVELHLLQKELYIRGESVLDVPGQGSMISDPSIATEPWKLAIDCTDDEFLDTAHLEINDWHCMDCPAGAYCRGPTTWDDVRPLSGYWRVPWQLDQFERCPFVNDCSGVDPTDGRRKVFGVNGTETNASATDGCIVGTTGVLCSSCSPGYNRDANVCSKCTSSSTPLRVAVLVIVILVMFLFWLAIKRRLKTAWRKYHSLYRDVLRLAAIFVTFSQINTSMPSIIQVPWPQIFVNFVSRFNVVNIDVFSLIGVQCVGNFDFYLGFIGMLSMPTFIIFYVAFHVITDIKLMNKRIDKISSSDKELKREEAYHGMYHLLDDDGGGCLSPREFHHLLLMFGWHVPVHACETLIIAMNKGKDKKAYHDDRGQVCLKENTFVAEMMSHDLKAAIERMPGQVKQHEGLSDDAIIRWVERKKIYARIMAGAVSLLLLAHTPVSRKVFQYFHCHELGDRSFLRADYSIECQSDDWYAFLPLVLIVLFTFTIMLPSSISVYLFINRKKLYGARMQAKIGWLYDPFHKGAEFWQVHDVTLKMILTGMLIYIPTSFRAAIAAMITVVSIANLNYFSPHKNRTLFTLTQVSFMVTCFKYLTGLMIAASQKNRDKANADDKLFGYMLVSVDIIFMCSAVVATIMTIFIMKRKIKAVNEFKQKMKERIKSTVHSGDWLKQLTVPNKSTKVVPTTTINDWNSSQGRTFAGEKSTDVAAGALDFSMESLDAVAATEKTGQPNQEIEVGKEEGLWT